ncbi:hypothetical protein ABZ345_39355 [Lentzea sp. NPDC005914]|uniref:hypothetical protein n=1 Tax=Lentzea sp. NPDC005914 TaxID=3154572 RepID=UPI0033DBEAE9
MGTKMLSVALAAIALGAVTVAPASAAEGNPIIEITSVARGTCLQIEVDPAPDRPRVVLADCTGAPDQRWEQIPVGDGRVILRNTTMRDCVEANFSLTNFWCDEKSDYQHAELVADRDGTVRIKYGDDYVDSSSNDVNVYAEPMVADSDHQRWRVRQTGTTAPPADTAGQVVRLEAVALDYGCLGVDGSSTPKSLPCADVAGQRFQRVELAGGGTALRSLANDKCLNAEAGAEAVVDALSECDIADTGQHWRFDRTAVGTYRVWSGERLLTPGDDHAWAVPEYPPFIPVQTWHVTAA